MVRAVLFDLDDTLFDHQHCAAAAIEQVRASYSCFADFQPASFSLLHGELLEELHARVVRGEIGLDEARVERFRRLFLEAGVEGDAARAASVYRGCYVSAWRPVSGAVPLLTALSLRVRIGVVSNNMLREQQEKIEFCGFAPYLNAVVVSEQAGVAKPDPAIFNLALEQLDCDPADAVMIGDSWRLDVLGAEAAGIRPVWLNRAGARAPEPLRPVSQLSSFEPLDAALSVVFADRGATTR